MKHTAFAAAMLFAILSLQGCATRDYGRQTALSDYERSSMGCPEIEQEMAKVVKFVEEVRSRDAASRWYDMPAVFSRYWIGNTLEKGEALESANSRIIQLWTLRDAKQCNGSAPTQPLSLPVDPPEVEKRF